MGKIEDRIENPTNQNNIETLTKIQSLPLTKNENGQEIPQSHTSDEPTAP